MKECALTVQTLKNIQQEGESLLAENISLREERDKLKCRLEEQAKH